jgi:hypothetical protein
MDGIDLEGRLTASPTRRTIVKTGVKLAYAAPILAASFKLSQAGVLGASGNPNPECKGSSCGSFQQCSTNPDCICTTTSTGGGFCVPGSTACAGLEACGRDGSCPSGSLCVVNSCCGDPVCVPVSLTCPPSDPNARSAATKRASTGPGTLGD